MLKTGKLGEGTFGKVYGAIDPHSPTQTRRYAVKCMYAKKDTDFCRNLRELDINGKLSGHPCIVQVEKYWLGNPFKNGMASPTTDDKLTVDNAALVLPQATMTLYDFLHGKFGRKIVNTVPYYQHCIKYMVQILLSIEYIHDNNVIHRDLKNNNFLLFEKDGSFDCKLCDFGFAKIHYPNLPHTPDAIANYMRPPEVILERYQDFKTDIWAIGCLFYEMFANTTLFNPARNAIDTTLLTNICKVIPIKDTTRRALLKDKKIKPYDYKTVPTMKQLIKLNALIEDSFNTHIASYDLLCDLLSGLLKFDERERLSATEALNHPFFKSLKFSNFDNYIATVRAWGKTYPLQYDYNPQSIQCVERDWMAAYIDEIRKTYKGQEIGCDRYYFHTMRICDLYLKHLAATTEPREVTEWNGAYLTKSTVATVVLTCYYMTVKYFLGERFIWSCSIFLPETADIEATKATMGKIEETILLECLNYKFYNVTIYEVYMKSTRNPKAEVIDRLLRDYLSGKLPKLPYTDCIGFYKR